MAVDSIMASPTNRVRVMVAEASGCWARALSEVATARPSARAGARHPMLVANPAVMIEAMAIRVKLSIGSPWMCSLRRCRSLRRCLFGLLGAGGRRDVDRSEDGEDVGLDHPRRSEERRV